METHQTHILAGVVALLDLRLQVFLNQSCKVSALLELLVALLSVKVLIEEVAERAELIGDDGERVALLGLHRFRGKGSERH